MPKSYSLYDIGFEYSKFYSNLFCNIEKEGCYVIGITGGSASGKTSVAKKIIEGIDIPWVVLLSMDSFYKGISTEGKSFHKNDIFKTENFYFLNSLSPILGLIIL